MSSDQLKALVIEKILYEQSEDTLHDVLKMLAEHTPQTVSVTPQQRDSIEAGLADYAAGRFVTQEDLDKEEGEWL